MFGTFGNSLKREDTTWFLVDMGEKLNPLHKDTLFQSNFPYCKVSKTVPKTVELYIINIFSLSTSIYPLRIDMIFDRYTGKSCRGEVT